MTKLLQKNIGRFLLLILCQVLILNNVLFLGYINPYIYLLFLLLLPFNTPQWLMLILGFALGISVDIFQDSMGLHAFATVFIAYLRKPILHFLLPQLRSKDSGNMEFSIQEFGLQRAFTYTTFMVFAHHLVLFSLEAYSFDILSILLRTFGSAIVSIILLLIIQHLLYKEAKR
jgi:rod shape-determining protein MreD